MTIAPCRHFKGFWLLGLNPGQVDGSTRFTDKWETRMVCDGYWSGEKWVRRVGYAMHFDSEAAAWLYFDRNQAALEALKAKETIAGHADRLIAH